MQENLVMNLNSIPLDALRRRLDDVIAEEKVLRVLIGTRTRLEQRQKRVDAARQLDHCPGSNANANAG